MNIELEKLRTEVRNWLAANAPKDWREAATHDVFVAGQRDWFKKLVAAGYAIPHWPAAWPGGGRSLAEQKVIYEELARADAPRLLLSFVSTYHAFATLHECGNDEQKARYLPRIMEGETWCQGFSEPGPSPLAFPDSPQGEFIWHFLAPFGTFWHHVSRRRMENGGKWWEIGDC